VARRRVAVFIDYQNCYGCARAAFHTNTDPGWCGHFSPRRLANLLASKGTSPYELTFVGVYAGLPDSTKDPRTYGARRKQMAGWEKEIVTVRARPLRYPHDWPNAKA
jgi:hypothetical protein